MLFGGSAIETFSFPTYNNTYNQILSGRVSYLAYRHLFRLLVLEKSIFVNQTRIKSVDPILSQKHAICLHILRVYAICMLIPIGSPIVGKTTWFFPMHVISHGSPRGPFALTT
jgi:hypothetical protein